MEGARAPKFRPYWIRYLVAFSAGEKLKWARDNVLVACLCSLAPGLIAAGIGAALSDHKWRAASFATLLTYGGLFALFLMWRLVATPLELDRENRRFINGLTKHLAFARLEVAALHARPPAVEVEIQEIHVQAAETELAPHASGIAGDCDIFLRVQLTLQQRGVPVEGWLHFCVKGIHELETGATIYRLTILTRNGAISRDTEGASLAERERRQFQKVPYASRAFLH